MNGVGQGVHLVVVEVAVVYIALLCWGVFEIIGIELIIVVVIW